MGPSAAEPLELREGGGVAVSKYRAAIFILHASLHRWERHSAALEAKRGASLDRATRMLVSRLSLKRMEPSERHWGRNNLLGEEGDK